MVLSERNKQARLASSQFCVSLFWVSILIRERSMCQFERPLIDAYMMVRGISRTVACCLAYSVICTSLINCAVHYLLVKVAMQLIITHRYFFVYFWFSEPHASSVWVLSSSSLRLAVQNVRAMSHILFGARPLAIQLTRKIHMLYAILWCSICAACNSVVRDISTTPSREEFQRVEKPTPLFMATEQAFRRNNNIQPRSGRSRFPKKSVGTNGFVLL